MLAESAFVVVPVMQSFKTKRSVTSGLSLAALITVFASCGGSSVAPSQSTSTPSPPPRPSLTLHVTSQRTGASLDGATVSGDWIRAAEGTPGTFTISWDRTYEGLLSIAREGYLTRSLWLSSAQSGEITADLIDVSPPFDVQGYRDLLFDGAQHLDRSFVRPEVAPVIRIYDTALSPGRPEGRKLSPVFIAQVADVMRQHVPLFSGGTLSVASVEVVEGTGIDVVGDSDDVFGSVPDGVIAVQFSFAEFLSGLGGIQRSGKAGAIRVGLFYRNAPTIQIEPGVLVPAALDAGTTGALVHELGHAMGFQHNNLPKGVLNFCSCTAVTLSDAEARLAKIAYSRPSGLTWEDTQLSPRASGRLLLRPVP